MRVLLENERNLLDYPAIGTAYSCDIIEYVGTVNPIAFIAAVNPDRELDFPCVVYAQYSPSLRITIHASSPQILCLVV